MNKTKYGNGVEVSLQMIDRLLLLKKMTRKDLGDRIGVPKQDISAWLNGRRAIPERHMISIAQALGVDSRVIFPDKKAAARLSRSHV